MEIETPAQIVAFPPGSVPPPYDGGAYFDLAAIGARRPPEQPQVNEIPRFLFRLRRAGPLPAFPDGPFSLNVCLQPAGDKEDTCNLEVSTATPGPSAIELLLEVRLEAAPDRVYLQLGAIDRAGIVSTLGTKAAANSLHGLNAITLSITKAGAGETWLEVSLLTTTAPPPDNFGSEAFDFDWLFGSRTGDGGRIDDPALMAALVEAQARCIRVSPRIMLDDNYTPPNM